jgi:hypothetical protein
MLCATQSTSVSRNKGAGVFCRRCSEVNRNLLSCILSLQSMRKLNNLRHLSRSQRLVTLPHGLICERRNTGATLRKAARNEHYVLQPVAFPTCLSPLSYHLLQESGVTIMQRTKRCLGNTYSMHGEHDKICTKFKFDRSIYTGDSLLLGDLGLY